MFVKVRHFFKMIWKSQLSLLSRAKVSQKYPRFNEVTWKFALLLSWAEIFAKIRLFWWCHFKIWTCPIITRWSVHQNKGPFYTFTSKYDLPLHYELKLLQKCTAFNEVTWKFELSLLSRGNFFAKSKAFLLMQLENSTCPFYHQQKFSQK